MSELLAAAAAALGTPEALVKRAAEARAAASGSSVDEVLAAWAGGEPAPTAAAKPPASAEAGTEEAEPVDQAPAEEPSAPEPAAPPSIEGLRPPPEPEPEVPAGPYKPPVLVGAVDNPTAIFAGVVGLFLLVLLVGLVGPAIPSDNPGARTSNLAFSDAAQRGQAIYLTMGCAACHTQMVRPVVADVGLGPVTLNDTNQVLGARRHGPDLSDIGSRSTAAEIEATIRGGVGHPPHSLSDADMARLVAYMRESRTSRQAAG